jgi:hypothetical protein
MKSFYQQTEVSSYTKTIATEHKLAHFQTRQLVVVTIHSSVHGQAPSYTANFTLQNYKQVFFSTNSPAERVMRRLYGRDF